MKLIVFLFFFPLALIAFEAAPVTPYPVLGYREIPFNQERTFSAWYPVAPEEKGVASTNPWDTFKVAIDAPAANAKEKRPVIILSHGYTGNPHQLSWMIRGLVHNGFIVIAMQHSDLLNGKAHINHWKRAQEISKMIDLFSESQLAKAANLYQIGITGFSLGGTTAIWIAGGRSTKLDSLIPGPTFASPEDYTKAEEALPTLDKAMMSKDWRDVRVKAAFIMAPGWAWLFDEANLQKVKIPVYLIAAEEDQVLVTKNNAGFFARNIPGATYQTIPGKANHYIFISALTNDQRKKADPTDQLKFLFEEDVSIDRSWIQLQVIEEAVRFFRSVFD